ncbi:MAG: peptide-binding protein [Deltaproteobacteria bacterium]|nr:peptide-binding protein [Deltaproteobacteria bacterium]
MLTFARQSSNRWSCWRGFNRAFVLIISLSTACCLLPTVLTGCTRIDKEANAAQAANNNTTTTPAYGDTIVEGTIGEPSVLIPMLAGDASSHNVAGLIINGLVKYDKDLSLIGDLAESWDISKDGLTITFRLRKGVRWTDGVEFTAHDVMFGYKTIIYEKTPTPYSEDFKQVKKAEAINKYTFRVTYEKPFAPALSSWGNLVVLPKHLLEGKDITKSELGRHPVGMGPYKFVKWTPGQEVVLESNPDYFEGRPYIDRYMYRIIPDPATMFLELKAGGIDWMGLTPIQYTKQTNTPYFEKNFKKYRYPAPVYTYMGLNLCLKRDKTTGQCIEKHPWFSDKRVRQAIAYAIDKQEIVDGVLFGLGSPATGSFVPNTWSYNPNVKKYEHNPEKAKQLLAEAGWKDTDGDNVLDKDGRPFEFTILTNQGNSVRINTATIIQWRLAQIGIKVKVRTLEWSTFINEFIDKRRFEAVVLGWSLGLDPDQYDIWHSSKTKEKEFNFVSYNNPEVDALLEKGRGTFDIEKRKKAYFRIQEILADELPYIFLYVPDATPVVHSRFKGIAPAPLIGMGYNIHKWYVPEDLQRHKVIP